MKPERLEELRCECEHLTYGNQNIVAELIVEVDRLRAAMAVVADPAMWDVFQYQETRLRVWQGRDEYADPMAWAAKQMNAEPAAQSARKRSNVGQHFYPGCQARNSEEFYTSDCERGCGCWMGSSRSGGPEGIDPFGACPMAVDNREDGR